MLHAQRMNLIYEFAIYPYTTLLFVRYVYTSHIYTPNRVCIMHVGDSFFFTFVSYFCCFSAGFFFFSRMVCFFGAAVVDMASVSDKNPWSLCVWMCFFEIYVVYYIFDVYFFSLSLSLSWHKTSENRCARDINSLFATTAGKNIYKCVSMWFVLCVPFIILLWLVFLLFWLLLVFFHIG